MARELGLGLNTGYWSSGPPPGADEAIAEADRLGFDSIWAAEAYGSDVLTPLAWWGAATENVQLGTAIMQMSARTPAAAAMAAMTMDHLSGGRFILGLGVSGPQVVEGWYGQPFAKPLARTREYVSIVRDIVARGERVTAPGPHYPLPYPDGTGPRQAAEVHAAPGARPDPDLPRRRRAEERRAGRGDLRRLAGALLRPAAPGLLPRRAGRGLRREGAAHDLDSFEVCATVPLIVHDDVEAAADMLRPMYALYFGGMGARGANFHNDVPRRMGYEAEAEKIQDLYLDGKKDEAAAAVPTQLIEELALIGPEDKIRHELEAWRESIATTLLIGGDAAMVRKAADLVLG